MKKYPGITLCVVLGTLSLVGSEKHPTFAKSNRSFFNLKPADADEKTSNRRVKRSTDFTSDEIARILARHNYHRSNTDPEASDMKYMSWDDNLADMAQEWSEECRWEHGNPANTSPFSAVGQNLWMGGPYSASASIDVEGVVDAWNNEVQYYNYDANSCSNVCGHYTQVVWASTYAVGCGIAHCTSVTSSGFTNAFIVTCNYGPAGNYPTRPFSSGSPCTNCASGIGQCYENQCRLCSEHSEPCVCNAVCQNCGTKTSDCTCTCQDGWHGSDCATACENTHRYCGANPGWYDASTCSFADYVPGYCPLMCGICNAADPSFVCEESSDAPTEPPNNAPTRSPTDATTEESSNSCSEYLTCQNGGTFFTQTCECVCTDEYEGSTCQHSKEQATYGVRVLIYGDIERFPSIESILHEIIAYILNRYCNIYFSDCCPGGGSKTSEGSLTFVVPSDIETADGYPVADSGSYWVMIYVRPQRDNALCADGSESRRRRAVQRLFKRSASDYLDQDTLLSVIEENVDELESSLNVTVGSVVAGGFEEESANNGDGGIPGWALALVVVFTLLVVATAILVGGYFLLKKTKPEFINELTVFKGTKGSSKIGIMDDDGNANAETSKETSHTNSRTSLKRNKIAPKHATTDFTATYTTIATPKLPS